MAPEEDRKQVGLTEEGRKTIALVADDLRWFTEGQHAARFALAYAIREDVPAGVTEGVKTGYGVDGFDDTGEIRALLAAIYPDVTMPVRLMEHLIDEGLRLIAVRIAAGERNPTAFLG